MASFHHSYDCFIVRGRAGNQILQRITLRDTRYQKDMIAIPETIAGSWSVQRRQFTVEEQRIAFKFTAYIRFTPLVLTNSEYPGTHTRLVRLWNLGLPARNGLEVPVGCVLNGGGLQDFNRYITDYNTPERLDWIHPYFSATTIRPELMREARQEATQPAVSSSVSVSYSFTVGAPLVPRVISAPAAQPVPHALPPATFLPTFPPPLKPFVARVLAEAARNKAEECPITLDSMASCRKLYVPTCGHVCSDAGCMTLLTCPVCRERTAWTPVEFTT